MADRVSAIKIGEEWYLATLVPVERYGAAGAIPNVSAHVWSELRTTAFLGNFDLPDRVVHLEHEPDAVCDWCGAQLHECDEDEWRSDPESGSVCCEACAQDLDKEHGA